MIPSLLHLQPPSFWRAGRNLSLYRFSPYFKNPEEWGITNLRLPSTYKLIYPFPEESLRRLAYFFDFDYADGRDPGAYTGPLVEMMRYWQDNYCPGALTCVSIPQKLVIYDRRPGAVKEVWELEGLEKAVYEYCDEAHSSAAIHRHLVDLGYSMERESLLHLLEEWVEGRLMLREGDWFLSLAVSADALADELGGSEVISQALAMTLAGMEAGGGKKLN
jgi:hypothetical protein